MEAAVTYRLPECTVNLFKILVCLFFFFFLMWTLFKVLIEFVQYCFCFKFWFFGCKACGILASRLGIEPHTPCIGR